MLNLPHHGTKNVYFLGIFIDRPGLYLIHSVNTPFLGIIFGKPGYYLS